MELNDWIGVAQLVAFVVLAYVLRPLLGEYSKVKGKNLATLEDVDRVHREIENMKGAVTSAVKEFEAKLAYELWDRQSRWEFRKDSYVKLAQGLSRRGIANYRLERVERELAQSAGGAADRRALEEELRVTWQEYESAGRRFLAAYDVAPLVASEDVVNALRPVSWLFGRHLEDPEANILETVNERRRFRSQSEWDSIHDRLIGAMKQDLGFAPLTPSASFSPTSPE